MHILVINSGSSSIKFSIFVAEEAEPRPVLDGELSNIGSKDATLKLRDQSSKVDAQDPAAAIHHVIDAVSAPGNPAIDAVGYRVVHPGPKIDRHVRIDDEVLADLEAAIPFAPLHDPEAIQLIRESMARFPRIPHFACFDTVFHQTMPPEATTYPIPLHFRDQGVRRYGFHGLSCESIVRQLDPVPERLIIAHLGSGSSVTAVMNGKSVDNTMGLTPTGGVVMGTRPGDLEPGLIFYLLRQPGATTDSVEHMLNHDAGLKALFGVNDMRKLRQSSSPAAQLALSIFCTSIRKAVGAFAAVHGLDTLVFTGGIGEHDPLTRAAVAENLFSCARSFAVQVLPAQEDLVIAIHVARMSAET